MTASASAIFRLALVLCASLCASCVPVMQKHSSNQLADSLPRAPFNEWSYAKNARAQIRKAIHLSQPQPADAAAILLSTARELAPHKSQTTWANHAYQLALGLGVQLVHEEQLWGQHLQHKHYSVIPPSSCSVSQTYINCIDNLKYAGQYNTPALQPTILDAGTGAPMVAFTDWTEERVNSYPFIPKVGQIYSLTVTAQWLDSQAVEFTLSDSRSNPNLSANYSVPTAFSETLTKELKYQGILNVLRPARGVSSMGLFSLDPVDPQRIPIILVHGLAASPNLWVKPSHNLLQNETIRDNYQLYAYFYPTGLPISHSAARLKKEIRRLETYLKQHGAGSKADQMVIIGHSMGGLLTSAVTRDYRGAASELYTKSVDSLTAESKGKDAIKELLEQPPLDCVTRAIFIATPHRGSKYADNWIGQFTSHLIEIPKNIVGIDPQHYRHDLTQAGREIFNMQEGMDGVQRLRYNNPALKYNLSRPKLPQVTYHSIIGDRGWGGKLENSSDGIVAYSSSHLEGVASELVVPSWHNAQDNDEAIEEIIRILKLHLH
ncbi:esterase/lipase family protein [Rubritalea tangerina]|uniref:Esterase/lipase family protein n=1 Tax=Rubritalea tangerina TaxID=430798 RepID=A0ABW4ZEN1_9BACT